MKISKAQFSKIMQKTSQAKMQDMIKLANKEIAEWQKFKRQCKEVLDKTQNK